MRICSNCGGKVFSDTKPAIHAKSNGAKRAPTIAIGNRTWRAAILIVGAILVVASAIAIPYAVNRFKVAAEAAKIVETMPGDQSIDDFIRSATNSAQDREDGAYDKAVFCMAALALAPPPLDVKSFNHWGEVAHTEGLKRQLTMDQIGRAPSEKLEELKAAQAENNGDEISARLPSCKI